MDKKYEALQLGIFLKLFQKGLVYQDYKPVYWSPSSRTALADAELEYSDHHVSKAIYVKMQLCAEERLLFPNIYPVYMLIWTTAPWTLVANKVGRCKIN
jgi:isoleucyl-tRNA synthetase